MTEEQAQTIIDSLGSIEEKLDNLIFLLNQIGGNMLRIVYVIIAIAVLYFLSKIIFRYMSPMFRD